MAEPFDIIQAINEQLSGKKCPLKSALKFYKRTLGQQFEAVMRESYSRTGGMFYKTLINARNVAIQQYGLRTSARKLGYSLEDIKQFKPGELSTIVYEKKRKPIDPVKVEQQVTQPPLPSANVQHKIVTQEIKKPVEPEVAKKDQATHRKTAARKAREHLKPNVEVTPTTLPLKLRIEKRAYEIWEKGGRVHGQDVQNWVQAKNEFIRDEAYNIYKGREGTKFVGSAEHDWFKAERRIEKELNYPEKAASAASRHRRLLKYKENVLKNVIEEKRYEEWETYVKNPTRNLSKDIKAVLEKGQQSVKSFFKDGDFARKTKLFWSKNRWARGAAKGLATTLALNLGLSLIRKTFQGPAIPSEYEKGYDIISSYATDFGSPLKLSKAAHKALRPYHSTVRNSIRTNVNAVINKNMALYSNQTAIGHMRY